MYLQSTRQMLSNVYDKKKINEPTPANERRLTSDNELQPTQVRYSWWVEVFFVMCPKWYPLCPTLLNYYKVCMYCVVYDVLAVDKLSCP